MTAKPRHELKFIISTQSAELLKKRLMPFMKVDSYANSNNEYIIKSLYFDDIYNTAYYEKLDGLEKREKYRIRIYNNDDSLIKLEKKAKNRDISFKTQTTITKKEYNLYINNKYPSIDTIDNELIKEFVSKQILKQIKPSIIVEYNRCALTYPIEDVRITFDSRIKSKKYNKDLFDNNSLSYDVLNKDEVVLEVKYNDFLPNHLKEILMTDPKIKIAISKFALCCENKEV